MFDRRQVGVEKDAGLPHRLRWRDAVPAERELGQSVGSGAPKEIGFADVELRSVAA